jgi:hypothetical protein
MLIRSAEHRWQARALHGVRVALVVALLWAIPSPRGPQLGDGESFSINELRRAVNDLSPDWNLGARDESSGLWELIDSDERVVGWAARTLPEASDVVGYRGPTEAAVVLDSDLSIAAVGLLGSADTEEHVAAVIGDDRFLNQFRGWSWGELPADLRVDAVSGATLTSLAMAEGVIKRMGNSRPSLVFPDPLEVDEVRDWFPEAATIDEPSGSVLDERGERIGRVLRTGSLSDDLVGYQGPTELLIRLNSKDVIEAVRIRRSFDNEPYVDYVRTEVGFWKLFLGMSLEELARFDPQQEGVEGVSGATMTSQTVADTLVAAAKERVAIATESDSPQPSWMAATRWSPGDLATIAMLLAAGWFSRLRWFRHRGLRRMWLVAVTMVIGLWAGNLISLALISGWSAEGIAWRLAPGLAAITAVAMLLPPLSKANPYCNHLCPHGAVQQLVKPSRSSRRRVALSPSMTRWLAWIPGITLVIAYLVLLVWPSVDLSSWEPFHAYLFRIAGWGSIALALLSIVVAATVPMAYCRWGCPTGRMIDYVRSSAASGRVHRADVVAFGLLVVAIARHFLGA